MIVKRTIPVLFLCIVTIYAQNKCCKGPENVLENKSCKGGAPVTGISCKTKYMLNPDTTGNFTIDPNGELVEDGIAPIPKNRYCITKENNKGEDVALVCFEEHQVDTKDFFVFRASCSFVSVIFLLVTISIYMLVPSLRDLQGICLLHSITGLALAMFLLGLLQFGIVMDGPACPMVGYITFASFLIAFTWLNVISFHIWRTTVLPGSLGTAKQWYFLYCVWGYGLPLIIVIAAIIGHNVPGNHIKPQIGYYACWFTGRQATWAYFYGPIAFLLVVNSFLFLWTIKSLWQDMKEMANNAIKIRSMKFKCLLYIKLFFVMGLSWIFEVISFATEQQNNFLDYIWMVTDFINGVQGVLIFIILIAFRKRALKGLAKRGLACFHLPEQWKTLRDEECDELMEEEQLNREAPVEHLYKSKENQSVP